jgi:molybdopterin/thiamine biosynthesis adenylyltransferase
MKDRLNLLAVKNSTTNRIYAPDLYRLSKPEDLSAFEKLLDQHPHLQIFDEIEGQLNELIKLKYPEKKLTDQEYRELRNQHLNNSPLHEYGVWAYYPWLERVVHLLDEEEYIEVRTNRNRNKITLEECTILAQKKVGIIGLSVGQSVATTIAMERSFGEIRIADFDILELSNLNRIRTGVYNLSIAKTVAVAREIAEIDPYLKVTCFHEGITPENITQFLTENGKLDVLIDECDGLDVKILCRQNAKELQIPVVMDTSDRGMLDIERFDLEPDRPILHGSIEHLSQDTSKLKGLTNEEKIPYVMAMIGADTMSKRMKASMLEIEQTITTWPQLASSVVLGGAIAGDVCRRIALNQSTSSGRYFVDLADITDPQPESDSAAFESTIKPLSVQRMETLIEQAELPYSSESLDLEENTISTLVEAGAWAPSTANNQPWRWHYTNGKLALFHEESRTDNFGDYNKMGTHISLGAAIENLVLKAAEMELTTDVHSFPIEGTTTLVAICRFKKSIESISESTKELANAIVYRCTNRKYDARQPISEEKLGQLQQVTEETSGAQLHFCTNKEGLSKLAHVIGAADRLRFLHPEGHYNFFTKEIRWTEEENQAKRDGLDLATIDLTAAEVAGLKMASDGKVIELINDWRAGTGFEKMSRKAVECASAIGLITMPSFDHDNYLNGGRAMQRTWLAANQMDLAFQPLMSPAFFFMQIVHGKGAGMPAHMIKELEDLRKVYLDVFTSINQPAEVFVFRLAKTEKVAVRSLRRPVTEILSFGKREEVQ